MGLTPAWFGAVMALAAIVAIVARRLHLPYTVGLVFAGILLAQFHRVPHIELTKPFIFNYLLPPLIFEASLYLKWKELQRDFGVLSVLATVGVIIAACITALGMHYLAGWDWKSSTLFGVLIAATDPVSVIAAFKEIKIGGRLQLLMEAESLFNDGTAAILFVIALSAFGSHAFTGIGTVLSFATITLGGVVCGVIVATLALVIAGRTEDHLVETAFTLIAAYSSFWLADRLHFSGVLATLSAGVVIGNFGSIGALTDKGRESIETFWEFAAFMANSVIFILIGLHLAHSHFGPLWPPILIAVLAVLLGRALCVYPCCALFAGTNRKVEMSYQHILFWSGLRGAIALALALGLPDDFAGREQIITTTFAVVAFSVVVQGVTMKPFLRKLGITR